MLPYHGSSVFGSFTPARLAFFHTTNSRFISSIWRWTSARTPRDLNVTVSPFVATTAAVWRSLRKAHLLQEAPPPRIVPERLESRQRGDAPGVAQGVGAIEPLEGGIHLAPFRVGVGDLKRAVVAERFSEFLQGGVGFLLSSDGVIDNRQRIRTKRRQRLTRGFRHRLVTTALRQQHEREVHARADTLRGEIDGPAERGFGLGVAFHGEE